MPPPTILEKSDETTSESWSFESGEDIIEISLNECGNAKSGAKKKQEKMRRKVFKNLKSVEIEEKNV